MLRVLFLSLDHLLRWWTIQKKILSDLAHGDRSNNDLSTAFCLSCLSLSTNKTRWNEKDASPDWEFSGTGWWITLWSVRLTKTTRLSPPSTIFDEEALQIIVQVATRTCWIQCDNLGNEKLLGIYCKLEIYIIRFCLVIQITRWLCGECSKDQVDTRNHCWQFY